MSIGLIRLSDAGSAPFCAAGQRGGAVCRQSADQRGYRLAALSQSDPCANVGAVSPATLSPPPSCSPRSRA
jgi:hypothetical protein